MEISNSKRKKPTENIGLILFDEVNGICPKCTKPVMRKENGRIIKIYEIAHIYPSSPLPHEEDLLKDEIILNTNVDHEDNLIVLCRDCHKIFDNPRSVEGYREMVSIKKELQNISKLKKRWFDNSIDEDIINALEALTNYSGEALEELSLEAIKVESKSDKTLNFLVKIKIKFYVQYFYPKIKLKFAELEMKKPCSSDLIYNQVKTYYIELKRDGLDQTQIFNALVEWLQIVTKCKSRETSEILISFFIQNCEVYS